MTTQYSLGWEYYSCDFKEWGFISATSFLLDYTVSGDQPSTFQFYNMFQGSCGQSIDVACGYFQDSDPNNSYIVNIVPNESNIKWATGANPPYAMVYNQTQNEMIVYITNESGGQTEAKISAGETGNYALE